VGANVVAVNAVGIAVYMHTPLSIGGFHEIQQKIKIGD
jgi:hypothetical protein